MIKRKNRSPAKRLAIVQYADKHGVNAAAERFNVSQAMIYNYRNDRERLAKLAARDAAQELPESDEPSKAKPASQPAPEPSTARQAITGLGPLIADVRAAVIEELSEEVGGKLAELIDARMPEIVSRELRRLLTEQALPTGQVHPLRPVAKRA